MRMKTVISAFIIAAGVLGAAPAHAQESFIMRLGTSAWLGFSYSEQRAYVDGERESRVVVTSVVEESPAAEAGLEEGDEVVAVNGLRATSPLLSSLSSSLEPGDDVDLEIRRDGNTRTVTITAAERPSEYTVSARQVYRFSPDSVVALARTMLDSALVSIDSLHLPDIRIEHRGDGNMFIWRNGQVDSLHAWSDSTTGFHYFSDSMRTEMDNVLLRMTSPAMRLELMGDSLLMLDSTMVQLKPFFGRIRDDLRELPGVGFLRLGMRALGGMSLEEVGPIMGEYFGTDHGLLVLEVAPESPAAIAGLREGDVIVRANGESIERIGELRDVVGEADGDAVTLTVMRQRRQIELQLTTDE